MAEIPQSNALGEATKESLDELLSRDPMGHQRSARDRVVSYLRTLRAGWEKVENAGGHKRKTTTKLPKGAPQVGNKELDL